jgi:DNA-binding LacI/PurR family transcriptional regulator
MADVASRVGVSRQLVSLVLRDAPGPSPETRQRVRQAAGELGYSPDIAAQMLRRKGTKYLGVIFTIEHSSEAAIVQHMHLAAAERGYSLVLGSRSSSRNEGTAVEELIGYRCEALILISPTMSAASLRRLSKRVPLVCLGSGNPKLGCDIVRSAGDLGIGLAVEHLTTLGHHHIAYVHGRDMPGSELRHQGYLSAMARRQLPPDVIVIRGDYTEESGAHAATLLRERPTLPTAVVTNNDHAALGLTLSLLRTGLSVPDDISITGYDDSRIAQLSSLDLTSVVQDPTQMGDVAVDCALSRISGERSHAIERVIPTSLSIRSSTGSPRHQDPDHWVTAARAFQSASGSEPA